MQLELVAQARADGRWAAQVAAGDAPTVMWPSTNGSSATVALDALEAQVREWLSGIGVFPEAER